MSKLLSGRFLFTVVTAAVFLFSAVNRLLSNEQTVSIIMLVVAFYFNKNQNQHKEG